MKPKYEVRETFDAHRRPKGWRLHLWHSDDESVQTVVQRLFKTPDAAFDYAKDQGWSEHFPPQRKGNPVATSKKKPTAAQLRARAEFARIMKSGGFGGAAKKAAKKPRRKNPLPAAAARRAVRPALPAPAAAPAIRRTSSSPGFGRATNPIYPPVRYEIWTTDERGKAGRFIAAFSHKGEAVAYAQIQADNKNKRVGIIIRGKAR